MQNATAIHLATLTGEPIHAISGGRYYAADGSEITLTPAQQRRIARLLDSGVPDTITAEVVDAEASSRIDQLIRPEDRELLIASGLSAIVDELAAQRAAQPEPANYAAAKANLGLLGQAAAIRTAAATIKAGTLPGDYLALVAAFDAALA